MIGHVGNLRFRNQAQNTCTSGTLPAWLPLAKGEYTIAEDLYWCAHCKCMVLCGLTGRYR